MEGSIIAKVGVDDNLASQSAVLANICHEYVEFGHEAFDNNTMKLLFVQMDDTQYVVKPVYTFNVCFVCDKKANLGLIKNKIDLLTQSLEEDLSTIKEHILAN
eukprot:CAMPEP_0202969232 /NCGR_PEP_ID=MMETSP1396-20130829/14881_1 /ASSEMBLY_ACC=CAM_ASM_000872 /TAXON_ID= /ORGANISM="Pseudokeronopsis sp., Strain Brazil" /LENGTH=102 /DNA_ID=CAMNT_0049696531 /DNA_START=123 /DNA_END=431 /DNA_ORIENTATION=+